MYRFNLTISCFRMVTAKPTIIGITPKKDSARQTVSRNDQLHLLDLKIKTGKKTKKSLECNIY